MTGENAFETARRLYGAAYQNERCRETVIFVAKRVDWVSRKALSVLERN